QGNLTGSSTSTSTSTGLPSWQGYLAGSCTSTSTGADFSARRPFRGVHELGATFAARQPYRPDRTTGGLASSPERSLHSAPASRTRNRRLQPRHPRPVLVFVPEPATRPRRKCNPVLVLDPTRVADEPAPRLRDGPRARGLAVTARWSP